MRFVHITDTHIDSAPDFINYGHSPRANLEALVAAINKLPFRVDFVLHTGDVVEDRSEDAYRIAKPIFEKLEPPIFYAAGNHDDATHLQRVLLGDEPTGDRFDYQFQVDGVQFVVLDTRGPNDPTGTLSDAQLDWLRALCTPDGAPLVIAMHHPPTSLDSPWLDTGWASPTRAFPNMLLDRGPEFMAALAPARARLRGVFFGHVHRPYQVIQDGILLCSAPSSFAQLLTWPTQRVPEPSPAEPGGFSLVTITREQTTLRQHYLPRPGATP